MKKRILIFLTSGLMMFLSSLPLKAADRLSLDVEFGFTWAGYNDVRIPGDTGTPFSLTDDFDTPGRMVYRLRLSYRIAARHTLSLLYAPLRLTATGSNDQPIFFEDRTFGTNTSLEGLYQFNSYRLTYRFTLVSNDRWEVGIGLTAKIRDAEIRLTSPTDQVSKTDLGFVPLLHFKFLWKASDRIHILLGGDALASPGGQGRAEDVNLALLYRVGKNMQLKAGYRIVEGGANVQSVYNFALLHYIVMGIIWDF
ncbi:hypothetical protein ACFLT9_05630 [Acidobacteriota bacterium]